MLHMPLHMNNIEIDAISHVSKSSSNSRFRLVYMSLYALFLNNLWEYRHIVENQILWAAFRSQTVRVVYLQLYWRIIGPKDAKFGKTMLNTDHYTVQGHSGSSLSVPVETWKAQCHAFKFTFCLAPFPRYRRLLAKLWITMMVSTWDASVWCTRSEWTP